MACNIRNKSHSFHCTILTGICGRYSLCFLQHGQLTHVSISIMNVTIKKKIFFFSFFFYYSYVHTRLGSFLPPARKKIFTGMKYNILKKHWFLPYKPVRKCSHFNKSVQTTRNLRMGPSSHYDKNILEM
jgi:hypothetical protein